MDWTQDIVLPDAVKLVNKIKVIGPRSLGASYPPFDRYSINESRIPLGMRFKYYEPYWDGERITLHWITQDEFDEDDKFDFIQEVKRALNVLRVKNHVVEPFNVLLDVESRNGESAFQKELVFEDLREAKYLDEAAYKEAKKKKYNINTNAGDVAQGISMFNNAMGTSQSMSEDLKSKSLIAEILDRNDMVLGSMSFNDENGKIKVKANLEHLPGDSILGFHIHESGECEAPYDSAGDHYNPQDVKHPEHSGDMPPLIVNKDGKAYLEFITDRFTLNEIEGKSVIIHSQRDDFKSQPAGDAGERIACGIIKNVEEEI